MLSRKWIRIHIGKGLSVYWSLCALLYISRFCVFMCVCTHTHRLWATHTHTQRLWAAHTYTQTVGSTHTHTHVHTQHRLRTAHTYARTHTHV